MKYTEIEHRSHRHRLVLAGTAVPYICDGCKQLGFTPCYQCEPCGFHLHEECAHSFAFTSHPFFKNCRFAFHEDAIWGRYCDACGQDLQGFRYRCTHNDSHDLHPCCLKLPHVLTDPKSGVSLYLRDGVRSNCSWCRTREVIEGVKGWSYVSSCGEYTFHVACLKEFVLQKWREGYFRNSMHGDLRPVPVASSGWELHAGGGDGGKAAAVRRGRRRGKWETLSTKILVFVRILVSAIFGDPTAAIAAVLVNMLTY